MYFEIRPFRPSFANTSSGDRDDHSLEKRPFTPNFKLTIVHDHILKSGLLRPFLQIDGRDHIRDHLALIASNQPFGLCLNLGRD